MKSNKISNSFYGSIWDRKRKNGKTKPLISDLSIKKKKKKKKEKFVIKFTFELKITESDL